MVSEDVLVNMIEKQTSVNEKILNKLDQLHGDLNTIDSDFNKALDKYGEFGETLKSVDRTMNELKDLKPGLESAADSISKMKSIDKSIDCIKWTMGVLLALGMGAFLMFIGLTYNLVFGG